MKHKGIHLVLNSRVVSITEEERLSIQLTGGELQADMVMMALGVRPDSKMAEEAGLTINEQGAIVVNECMQTSDPHIYAVGDAVEVTDFVTGQKAFIPLAGPANKQGRIAADHICGLDSRYQGTQGSAIIKVFDMTVAVTGINEKKAKQLGLSYEKSFTYSANHASYYPGSMNMSIKTIFIKETGKIVGAQIVGFEGTDKRCDVFATAIRAGMTGHDLTHLELCYAPPYSSAKDPVNMAGYVIENIVTGKVNIFHWDQLKNIPENAITLDVRTQGEYQKGHIDGFINIPLDKLRNRLDELDKQQKVYVHCHSGLRSYIACRILSQRGFECYNISGGYRLYMLY